MTQETIAGYRKLCREIEITKDEIAELYSTEPLPGAVKGSHTFPPYNMHFIPVGLQKSPHKLKHKKEKLERLEQQRQAIEQYVDNIEDDKARQVIKIYYMLGKRRISLQAVATRTGYWDTESGPRSVLRNFFGRTK